jgi:TetR/AcrR family transcriptional regulator, cholesterol catabolism regulator
VSRAPGRRERKKLETRDRILDCAIALFATHGYHTTTMGDIGECADVARATVFNYFARKEDLVVAWFDLRRDELAVVLAESETSAADTPSRLRGAFRAIAHLFEDDPRAGRAMVRAWLLAGGPLLTPQSDTSQMFADIIRGGQQHGDIAPDVDADRVGRLLFDAYLGDLYRWVNDDHDQFALQRNLLATLEILLTGIAVDELPEQRRRTAVR